MSIKSIIALSIGAFWLAVAILLLQGGRPRSDEAARAPSASEPGALYDLSEVSRHDAPDDCWMAIEGLVFDVSDYIDSHPSAPEVVTRHCGTDATEAYRTKGGAGRDHSPYADRSLAPLAVGRLADDAPAPTHP